MTLRATIALTHALAGIVVLWPTPSAAQVTRPTYQVRFAGPAPGMRVDYQGREGRFSGRPLVTPARLDFPQPGIYRLKLTHIPGHEGVTLYPTLEIAPVTPRSEAFLAHSAIAMEFTERDIAEAVAGKFVTRVMHLPEGEDLAFAGGGSRRGSTLAIVRLGDRQLEEP
jgi:hypothetical protein